MNTDIKPKTEWVSLQDLQLDNENPRFGNLFTRGAAEQSIILDRIVTDFGVDDILGSMASNGYFTAEPLVGIREAEEKVRVIEGNRRLTAALILERDPRAKNQRERSEIYQAIRERSRQLSISQIPVLIYSTRKELLPYLGVRHITALKTWDSFAKAVWITRVIESAGISLDEIGSMIGDEFRTVKRLAEGYYFIDQLQRTGRFHPEGSYRSGRGSNTDYPFSWIYTALGYQSIRSWLKIPDEPVKDPVGREQLDDAGDLVLYMLGDKKQGRMPAINDSREISRLARVIDRADCRVRLKQGKSLEEVEEFIKPVENLVRERLVECEDSLQRAMQPLNAGQLTNDLARDLIPLSGRVLRIAKALNDGLRNLS